MAFAVFRFSLRQASGLLFHIVGCRFLAGLGSGMASAIALQPLDVLKTQVQQKDRISVVAWVKDCSSGSRATASLWRGTVPSLLRTGFGSAVYFTSLDFIRHVSQGRTSRDHGVGLGRSNAANLVGGAAARTFAGLITMPLTVIKVRFESSQYSYSSVKIAASDIYAHEGYRGFFTGFGATAMRDAPYAGLYVLFYETFKTKFTQFTEQAYQDQPQSFEGPVHGVKSLAAVNFTSGLLSGSVCSAISNPLDAVKTRIQLQPMKYINSFHAFRRMVVEEGVSSLFRGLSLRMTRKALSSALAWTLYEEFTRAGTVSGVAYASKGKNAGTTD